MDCNSCKERQRQAEPVSFQTHQADMARMNVSNRRMFVIIITLIVALVGSNAAWIWHETQFVDESATVEVDTGEGDAYVAGIGDVTVGESESDRAEAHP